MRALLILVGIALLWGGGQGLYTSAFNREATATTCAEYDASEQDATWIQLDQCVPDWDEMAFASYFGSDRPTELFIPLRSPDSTEEQIEVMLVSKDEELLALAGSLIKADSIDGLSEARLEALAERVVSASEPQSYDGMVQFGIELDDEDRDEIAAMTSNLADDYVMVEHHAKPKLTTSLLMTLAGLASLLLGLFLIFVRRNAAA